MQKPVLISIEGNIGSGKSTLLRQLAARNPTWRVIQEPVESWMGLKNASGESLLELFYKDTKRWAYTFQNTALLTRILAVREAMAAPNPSGIFLTERCIQTDANVFAKLMATDGQMDSLEEMLYRKWYDAFADEVARPSAYVHVDTPVTICHERILKRSRHGEEGNAIPIEYLDKLDSAHFQWLHGPAVEGAPVLRVDNASKDPTPLESVEAFIRAQADGPMQQVE
jgi:deoxyguanosine kinase